MDKNSGKTRKNRCDDGVVRVFRGVRVRRADHIAGRRPCEDRQHGRRGEDDHGRRPLSDEGEGAPMIGKFIKLPVLI